MSRLMIFTAVLVSLLLPALTGCATRAVERSSQREILAEPASEPQWASAVTSVVVLAPTPVAIRDGDAITAFILQQRPSGATEAVGEPTNIWDRLRRGLAMPPLENSASEKFALHFARTDYLLKQQVRARRYLFFILNEIERRGMPTELALLPFVESSMNPQARSPVGAMGAWQFMPATGRRFDMRISRLVDDRKNVMESTRAALDYLQQLHAQFGDWHLALAGYNWGEGNVAKAQKRNLARGLSDDYLSLSMPTETRNYVPQLEALKRLIVDPERYGTRLPEIPNFPYFQQVAVSGDLDIILAIRWADVPEAEFFALNPSARRPLLMVAATPTLLLPFDAAERFVARQNGHIGRRAGWTAITLGGSKRVESIAAQHGVTPRLIRDTNGIPAGMKPVAGSTLLVPVSRDAWRSVDAVTVANASLSFVPDVVQVKLRARKGDTLAALARRSLFDVAELARWNKGLHARTRLVAGQTVIAFVHPDRAKRMEAVARLAPKRHKA